MPKLNRLTPTQVKLTLCLINDCRLLKSVDKRGPLLDDPGYEKWEKRLQKIRKRMRDTLNELLEI